MGENPNHLAVKVGVLFWLSVGRQLAVVYLGDVAGLTRI